MNTILQINTSLFGEQGQSSRLAAEFAGLLAASTGRTRLVRDLARNPVPHLTAERVTAFGMPVSERTLEQQRYVAESDALIDELRHAVLPRGRPDQAAHAVGRAAAVLRPLPARVDRAAAPPRR